MDTFDYIIVGAGSAGCVLANRLTEDPNVTVLLLEAGGKDRDIWIHIPAGFAKLLDKPGVNWRFGTEPEEYTGNRAIPIPRGRVLGGSSSINGMLYVRGQPQDYDVWAQMGNRGWSYDDILPYFKKSESFERGGNEARGGSGLLRVSDMIERSELLDKIIEAAEERGYKRNPDYNSGDQEGFGYYQTTIRNGRRHSTARAFLAPAAKRPNLKIETDAHAEKVTFEGRRAVGVRWDVNGAKREARAGREVILAAGAVQSPQLLELSGIGAPELLKGLGLDVLHAAPGVGENFRDHYIARMNWRVKKPITLNEQTRGLRLVGEVLKYAISRRGALTYTAGIAHGFVKSRPELETPDIQYHAAHASYRDAKTRALDHEPGMTFAPCQLRPESRGSIHIKSADPKAPPSIRANFLSEQLDRDTLVAGMKIAREIAASAVLADYVAHEIGPGADCRTDEELLDWARLNGGTVYHPIGTCRMGQDPLAVVDERLRVRGVEGLRVVDASIMPTLSSGNTNAPVIMIAEKASDMIKEDAKAPARTPDVAAA